MKIVKIALSACALFVIPPLLAVSMQKDYSQLPQCRGNVCTVTLKQNAFSPAASEPNSADMNHFFLTSNKPSIQIVLPSNPTTGYQWNTLSYDSTLLSLTHQYQPPTSTLIGAGGLDQWTITATPQALKKVNQNTQVVLIYHRSWEKNVPPVQQKTIKITIN